MDYDIANFEPVVGNADLTHYRKRKDFLIKIILEISVLYLLTKLSLCLMPGRFSRLTVLVNSYAMLLIGIFSWCVYELSTW